MGMVGKRDKIILDEGMVCIKELGQEKAGILLKNLGRPL